MRCSARCRCSTDHLLSRGRYFQQLGRTHDALRIPRPTRRVPRIAARGRRGVQFRLGELQLRASTPLPAATSPPPSASPPTTRAITSCSPGRWTTTATAATSPAPPITTAARCADHSQTDCLGLRRPGAASGTDGGVRWSVCGQRCACAGRFKRCWPKRPPGCESRSGRRGAGCCCALPQPAPRPLPPPLERFPVRRLLALRRTPTPAAALPVALTARCCSPSPAPPCCARRPPGKIIRWTNPPFPHLGQPKRTSDQRHAQ